MTTAARVLVSEFVEQRMEIAPFVLPYKPGWVHAICQLKRSGLVESS
jgi:hypothetical protein